MATRKVFDLGKVLGNLPLFVQAGGRQQTQQVWLIGLLLAIAVGWICDPLRLGSVIWFWGSDLNN